MSGKTYTAHLVIDEYLKRGQRVLWLAHQTLHEANQAHDRQMVYASIQTLARQQRLVVVDEAHHSVLAATRKYLAFVKSVLDSMEKQQ